MSEVRNGVIDVNTGFLLRSGYCDFENDGAMDVVNEAQYTGVPEQAKILGNPKDLASDQVSSYDINEGWIFSDRPV